MTAIVIVGIVCITIIFLSLLNYRAKEDTILEMYERYLESVNKKVEEHKNDEKSMDNDD